MAAMRTELIIGVLLVCALGVQAGPGDPPVIVLPSARAAQQASPAVQAPTAVQVPAPIQAPPAMIPKIELLPPPAELTSPSKSPLPAAPPLLAPAENTLRKAPVVPTLTPKEIAPPPHLVVPEQPSQGPIPSALAPPGESTMPFRTAATAAALTAMLGSTPMRAADPLPPADYAKADDVKALKTEIEGLRKQLTTLTGTGGEASKATDVKALKDEVESLRKDIAGLAGKAVEQPKATDLKALKEEIANLKKDIAAMSTKPADPTQAAEAKAVKEEMDAIRKDVQTLNVFLRESIEGKVEKGFTHEGMIKRLQKLDDSIESLAKKMQTLETTRVAGSSPLAKVNEIVPGAAHGTVRILNDYPVEISMMVNGIAHRLEPNTKKDVVVPAGSFKYQLLTSGAAETERSIKDTETVTLTIR